MPKKRILTLWTASGKVYQKIKLKDCHYFYRDIEKLINLPELSEVDKKFSGIRIQDTIDVELILMNKEDNRTGIGIMWKKIVDLNVMIGFEVERTLTLNISYSHNTVPEVVTHVNIENVSNMPMLHDNIRMISLFATDDILKRFPNFFPKHVHKIRFSDDFQHKIENLPENLKVLSVWGGYLEKFPENLMDLDIGSFEGRDIPEIPESVTDLWIAETYSGKLPKKLPKNLKSLMYDGTKKLPPIPENLKELFLEKDYNIPLPSLPDSITHIELGDKYSYLIKKYPSNLKVLDLGKSYFYPLGKLPKTLIELIYYGTDKLPELPENFDYLSLPNYNHPLPDPLPKNLRVLHLDKYDHPLPSLPPSMRFLDLSCDWRDKYGKTLEVPENCQLNYSKSDSDDSDDN